MLETRKPGACQSVKVTCLRVLYVASPCEPRLCLSEKKSSTKSQQTPTLPYRPREMPFTAILHQNRLYQFDYMSLWRRRLRRICPSVLGGHYYGAVRSRVRERRTVRVDPNPCHTPNTKSPRVIFIALSVSLACGKHKQTVHYAKT